MNPNEQIPEDSTLNVLREDDLDAAPEAEDLSSPAKSQGTNLSDEVMESGNTIVAGDTIPVTKVESLNKNEEKEAAEVSAKDEKIKARIRRLNISIIICVLLLMIPVSAFGYIVYQAWKSNNTPIEGNRFVGQHQPEITETLMENAKTKILSVEGVESADIHTVVATTRVLVDMRDDMTEEELRAAAEAIYAAIDEVLPIATYYTNTETIEMYDLDISVYNNLTFKLDAAEGEPKLLMMDVVKNGMMPEPIYQLVSTAKNPDAAKAALESVEERKREEAAEAEAESQEGEQSEEGESSENPGEGAGEGSEGGE